MNAKLLEFQNAIGYQFHDSQLLKQALTHKSYAFENSVGSDPSHYNERLEFLGDAVLDLVITKNLMKDPQASEGELSKRRAALVNEKSLASVARQINLAEYIALGKGEERTNGASKDSILSSALEAVWGAVFLDRGFEAAASVIERFVTENLVANVDYKSELQERWQAENKLAPIYKLDNSEGPDHQKIFYVSVYIGEIKLGSGIGKSRKEAEQDAAKQATENSLTNSPQTHGEQNV